MSGWKSIEVQIKLDVPEVLVFGQQPLLDGLNRLSWQAH